MQLGRLHYYRDPATGTENLVEAEFDFFALDDMLKQREELLQNDELPPEYVMMHFVRDESRVRIAFKPTETGATEEDLEAAQKAVDRWASENGYDDLEWDNYPPNLD